MKKIVVAVVVLVAAFLTASTCWAGGTAGRPKITGIAYVKFKVTDLEKAKTFYGEELGLGGGGVRNGNSAQASWVVNRYQSVELAKTELGTRGSCLAQIGLATDSLPKMRAYLTARGVAAGGILQGPYGMRYFETQDPEGNKIAFVEGVKNGEEVGTAGPISKKMIHAGFVVKDRAAMDLFYKDILGFRLYWSGGMEDGETDWVAMQVPDGTDWIEYMLNVNPKADKQELGVMNHISLGVVSVKAAAEQLEKAGFKLPEPPQMGRDGKWQLNLYDPDWTRVELMEFAPVEKPCCAEFTGPHPKP